MSDQTRRIQDSEGASGGDVCETGHTTGGGDTQLVFRPPMYIRRYDFVAETLAARPHIHSVVDFGCAEGQLVTRLSACLEQLEWIVGVDIDASTLKANASRIQPPTMLYSIAGGRFRPLYVALFQGSITYYDQRMANASAVTLVEVIEHLENDVLEGAVVNVFGRLAPELVIVTTPNAEFNVLIPGLRGMRHYDHKFEWTRSQFQNWCRNICERYSYDMSTHEIGEDPLARDVPVGCCTQAAVFTRRCEALPSVSLISLEVAKFRPETSSKTPQDDGGGRSPGSCDVCSTVVANGESVPEPDVQQHPTETPPVGGRLQSGTCDRSSDCVRSGGIETFRPADPATSAAVSEAYSNISCNDCLREAEGDSEEAALDHEHRKHDFGEQKHDCGASCSAFNRSYCLIAEYFVPARRQPSPMSELANELLYQLLHISRAREEEQCYTYDDHAHHPCYFCANSSSPPESLIPSDDDGDFIECSSWPAPKEGEPIFPSTATQREWCDYAVDTGSATCSLSNHASAQLIEDHRGHTEATASDAEATSRSPEGLYIRTTASPSWSEQELAWCDDGLRSTVFVTGSEHSTADVSEDGDLTATSPPVGVLLGSPAGSVDPVTGVASAQSLPSELSTLRQGYGDLSCLPWPPLSEAANASTKDAAQTDDIEECSRCPIHIAVHCLMRCHRVRELCDGQSDRVIEAVQRLGYDVLSSQRVVVYRQHGSRRS